MPKVKKGNRILTVEELDKEHYLNEGYDEVNYNVKTGQYEVIQKATGGRMYTVKQYNAVVQQLEEVKKENEKLTEQVKLLQADFKKAKGK